MKEHNRINMQKCLGWDMIWEASPGGKNLQGLVVCSKNEQQATAASNFLHIGLPLVPLIGYCIIKQKGR